MIWEPYQGRYVGHEPPAEAGDMTRTAGIKPGHGSFLKTGPAQMPFKSPNLCQGVWGNYRMLEMRD